MKGRLAVWRDVIVTTFKNWFAHDSMSESAALAYYTVFSLAPVLLDPVRRRQVGDRSLSRAHVVDLRLRRGGIDHRPDPVGVHASFIVLLGAEYTHAYAKRLEKHATPPEAGAERRAKKREA